MRARHTHPFSMANLQVMTHVLLLVVAWCLTTAPTATLATRALRQDLLPDPVSIPSATVAVAIEPTTATAAAASAVLPLVPSQVEQVVADTPGALIPPTGPSNNLVTPQALVASDGWVRTIQSTAMAAGGTVRFNTACFPGKTVTACTSGAEGTGTSANRVLTRASPNTSPRATACACFFSNLHTATVVVTLTCMAFCQV